MAALIENNEGHIEHMVAVLLPFPPSSLLPSLCFCLSQTCTDKRFCQTLPQQRQRSVWPVEKGCEICFSFSSDSLVFTNNNKGSEKMFTPPGQIVVVGNTGISIVFISIFFVLMFALHYQGPCCQWEFKNRCASRFHHHIPRIWSVTSLLIVFNLACV
ncbi:hypothetical protein GOODEAATRI_022396 [Goodea atripinnis]|uniref:Uncharacterized protein n=1 Tax=Goodea atripinnis TaxID=208336 RepID=A0ABV0MUF1_9TELE